MTAQNSIRFSGTQAAQRSSAKLHVLLKWLWRWKFADAEILGNLWGVSYRTTMQTLNKYEQDNLIGRIKCPGMPSSVFYLKSSGAVIAQQLMSGSNWLNLKPRIYPSELGLKQVQHDLAVQYLVLDIRAAEIKSGEQGLEVLNDRQMRFANIFLSDEVKKIPDALIKLPNKDVWAVEMVETMYRPFERKRVFWLHAKAANQGKIKGTIFASTLTNYVNLLRKTANADCGSWKYNKSQKRWINVDHGIKYVNKSYVENNLKFIDLSQYRAKLYTYA